MPFKSSSAFSCCPCHCCRDPSSVIVALLANVGSVYVCEGSTKARGRRKHATCEPCPWGIAIPKNSGPVKTFVGRVEVLAPATDAKATAA
ncbi:hypothetical protein BGX29_003593 [Mortierella sp. GBA35]|nr:hypothetical protein BGX29_003593 [Mortierella sp. GBA35]